jgi:hypothetical protein
VDVDRAKDLLGQAVRFEQPTKLEQRRGIRRRLPIQVNADEGTNGPTVVNGIFDPFVRQSESPRVSWRLFGLS